ncbi:MAG: NnrS family protein [Lautropia sp.]|nr:NnrS family protein [Lautropia sp.]
MLNAHPLAVWRLDHPVWLCPFRAFFGLAIVYAPMLMLNWLLVLGAGWPAPTVPGGPIVWHAHELILGVSMAAVAGFVLTAVPEFTQTPAFAKSETRRLVFYWLLARMAFWATPWWPAPALVSAFMANIVLLSRLFWMIRPRIWQAPGRRHQGFIWGLAALYVTTGGFYVDVQRDPEVMRWLHASLGVMLTLIVVAMSRISMTIVNDSIDLYEREHPSHGTEDGDGARTGYLARPPRRHMAVFCISLFTLMQWHDPSNPVVGWLALASSAAMLNLLNDWHVGRALWQRWPLMLYSVYLLMALGYGLIGFCQLGGWGNVSGGLHLLSSGALSLAIYLVICIAGYTHSGLSKDGRGWVTVGAALIIAGALLRTLSWSFPAPWLLSLSGLLWAAAFIMQASAMLPVFLRRRADGGSGCEGILDD